MSNSIETGQEREMSHREILREIAREAAGFALRETRRPAHIAMSGGLTALNVLAAYLELKSGTKLSDSDMIAVMGTSAVALSYNATVAAAYIRGPEAEAGEEQEPVVVPDRTEPREDILLEEAAQRRAWMDGEDSIV